MARQGRIRRHRQTFGFGAPLDNSRTPWDKAIDVEGKVQMFFDHVEYQISDYRNSFKFYSACLIPLGFKLTTNNEKNGIFGFGLSADKSDDLLLTAGTATKPAMHICFSAKSEAQVDEFYRQRSKPEAFAMAHLG